MLLKAKPVSWTITLTGVWICPHCNEEVTVTYNPSPYRQISEDPADEMCPICKEFFTLNFYNN